MPSFAAIASLFRADEAECVTRLMPAACLEPTAREQAAHRAAQWVEAIRTRHRPSLSATDMLARYGLSSTEGIALMCLAEALLRIPDPATADALIQDKLSAAHWDETMGSSTTLGLNIAGWALAVTGKITAFDQAQSNTLSGMLGRLTAKLSQPVLREAIRSAMGWMADQFVLGETMARALDRANSDAKAGVRFSYDMLGEGARTAEDAARYYSDYERAIAAVAAAQAKHDYRQAPGISIKLSALHPRYEFAQRARVHAEMLPRLIALCEQAARHDVPITIDAEEADRLYLALELFATLLGNAKLGSWEGLGFAVQAYDKRAPAVIDFFAELAQTTNRRLGIRLVKGAYWDTEIKRAQERGWSDFPVYTRKQATDVSYLACARRMLDNRSIKPVFGTHNALTVAHILELTRDHERLEFQRLHGMGTELHALLREEGLATCVYAPVGDHEVLLGYLVRRLLENGANSSFVHQLYDSTVPVAHLTRDPVAELKSADSLRHPSVKLPGDLFQPERKNSRGLDLADPFITEPMLASIAQFGDAQYHAAPLINGKALAGRTAVPVRSPADHRRIVGTVSHAEPQDVAAAFAALRIGMFSWRETAVAERAACLERLADLLESNHAELIALLAYEAGRTLPDALSEVREAVDFCRYYAAQARKLFIPQALPGPTGEDNILTLHGRGIFACVSPWNFPLAIFLGQITAALVAGNAVIAKPAPQTPLITAYAVKLMLQAGIPVNAIALLPGGPAVGQAIIEHSDLAGVAFTGSTATAKAINRTLAAKEGPIVPLIAETGGQNALIVDSSALPEQVIDDVLTSAFRSAGQRCSALRVLCLPHATADKLLQLLQGAMQELQLGDPVRLDSDIGPVIDNAAHDRLAAHVQRLRQEAKEIYTLPVTPELLTQGSFVAPQAWEIPAIGWLTGEVFGPILHVVRYAPTQLDELITAINKTGFGLTGGIHSRIGRTVRHVEQRLAVGNCYVNRSLIGAVVGSQPFGGVSQSGTGPKAGGPHYLLRFASERVTSINTVAAGGNASLLMTAGS
jgi:RHH-type proline utilization regulon transcriptional repressor/proline dehydrogenase/delta 1-pyrroline-5-carboxylate dehydrogenase